MTGKLTTIKFTISEYVDETYFLYIKDHKPPKNEWKTFTEVC